MNSLVSVLVLGIWAVAIFLGSRYIKARLPKRRITATRAALIVALGWIIGPLLFAMSLAIGERPQSMPLVLAIALLIFLLLVVGAKWLFTMLFPNISINSSEQQQHQDCEVGRSCKLLAGMGMVAG